MNEEHDIVEEMVSHTNVWIDHAKPAMENYYNQCKIEGALHQQAKHPDPYIGEIYAGLARDARSLRIKMYEAIVNIHTHVVEAVLATSSLDDNTQDLIYSETTPVARALNTYRESRATTAAVRAWVDGAWLRTSRQKLD